MGAGTMSLIPAMPVEVKGWTPAGYGIWVIIGAGIIWWIRGMSDRKRAANEGATTESGATAALIKHLTAEVERLGTLVTIQSARITELEHKFALVEGENIRLKAVKDALGENRQMAANIVAADRLADRRRQEK